MHHEFDSRVYSHRWIPSTITTSSFRGLYYASRGLFQRFQRTRTRGGIETVSRSGLKFSNEYPRATKDSLDDTRICSSLSLPLRARIIHPPIDDSFPGTTYTINTSTSTKTVSRYVMGMIFFFLFVFSNDSPGGWATSTPLVMFAHTNVYLRGTMKHRAPRVMETIRIFLCHETELL